jgi:hypothetical protein
MVLSPTRGRKSHHTTPKLTLPLQQWGIRCHIINKKAKEVLGVEFTPVAKGLVDMGHSLIDHGYIFFFDKRR